VKSIQSIFKILFIFPILIVTFSITGVAYADNYYAKVINVHSKQLFVLNDGEKYTELKPGVISVSEDLAADVRLDLNAGISGKVKSWSTWLAMRIDSGPIILSEIAFQEHGTSHSYPRFNRPKEVHRTETIVVPRTAISNLFATQCNRLAETLRNQGLSNQEIFSTNRSIEFQIRADVSASYTGLPGLYNFIQGPNPNDPAAEIICMKSSGPIVDAAGDLQTSTGVTSSTLTIIEQSTVGGSCKVNLSTAIKTNLPNTTVKYRFEHTNGNKSDVKTVKTDHSQTAFDSHWYDVPKDPYQSETGSVRIIGVSHDFESSWQSYNMTCNEDSPNTISLAPSKPVIKEFSIKPTGNVLRNGMSCPTAIKITTKITSKKEFNGNGVITMKRGNYAFATHDVNIQPFFVWNHTETFALKPWGAVNAPIGNAGGSNTWQTEPSTGPATPTQRFELRYSLSVENKNVLNTPFKTITVSCTAPQVNQQLLPSNNGGLKDRSKPSSGKPSIKKQEIKKLKTAPVQKQKQPMKLNKSVIKNP